MELSDIRILISNDFFDAGILNRNNLIKNLAHSLKDSSEEEIKDRVEEEIKNILLKRKEVQIQAAKKKKPKRKKRKRKTKLEDSIREEIEGTKTLRRWLDQKCRYNAENN